MDNYKMSSTPKFTKKQKYKSFFKGKLLRKYITFKPED